jgi:leader peptidase (prepilin peptidase) / N-methyltransferase
MPAYGVTWSQPSALLLGIAAAGIAASLIAAPSADGVAGAALAVLATLIAACDAQSLRIPNELNLGVFALGLVHAGISDFAFGLQAVVQDIAGAIVRGAALALVFLLLRVGYRFLRKRDGIGLGDVKLAGAAGAWLDWPTMPVAIEIAALVALVAYALRQRTLGRSLRRNGLLPFGVFLAPAIWLGWLIETAGWLSQ